MDYIKDFNAIVLTELKLKEKRDLLVSNIKCSKEYLWSHETIAQLLSPRDRFSLTKVNNKWYLTVYWNGNPKDAQVVLLNHKLVNVYSKKNYINNPFPLLHLAVMQDDITLVNTLFGLKADINLKCKRDRTPISFAVSRGNLQMTDLLIQRNADLTVLDCVYGPTKQDGKLNSLMHTAYEAKPFNPDILTLLEENGVLRNSINKRGQTPIHSAVCVNNIYAVVYWVNKHGVDTPEEFDMNGNTLLHDAMCYKRLDIITYLLNQGASLHQPNNSGLTPFAIWNEKAFDDESFYFATISLIQNLTMLQNQPMHS